MVWDRLLGCFGDPLLRRFGAEPPPEWNAALGTLNAIQLDRGMRRVVFGWKGGPPSLPDFMRLCRNIGNDEFDDGREPARPQLTGPDSFTGDSWDTAANRYLLGYITKNIPRNPQVYGDPATYDVLARCKSGNGDASPEFIARVSRLVAAKNEWAFDMRDIAVRGEVPVEMQKQCWREYMERAETKNSQPEPSEHQDAETDAG